MADWIPLHSSIRKGKKRAISRSARFVYLEICLLAREGDGELEIIEGDVVDAVFDALGGDRSEIAEAWPALTGGAEPMVREVRDGDYRYIVVPSWDRWRVGTDSKVRMRALRAKRRERAPSGDVTVRESDVTVPHAPSQGVTERDGEVRSRERERVEESREEERESVTVTGDVTPPVPELSETEREAAIALDEAADLWPSLSLPSIADTVRRLVCVVENDPHARRDGLDPPTVAGEAAAKIRAWAAKNERATEAQRLAQIPTVVRWILDDCRRGKRRPDPRLPRLPPGRGGARP